MDILRRIVQGMTKEEVRHYKMYAERMKVRQPRKDILLFDSIRKLKRQFSEEEWHQKLYPEQDKNAFYRLKNRLTEDLHKSLLSQYFFRVEGLLALNYFSLAKFYALRNEYTLAHHLIRKAEKKAIETEDFELLDVVYSLFIKLSHEIVDINPVDYIRKRQENYEQLKILRTIDDLLAAVDYRMKVTQNFGTEESSNMELLRETIDEFTSSPEVRRSTKLRIRIFHALSKLLIQKKDYPTLENYLLTSYQEFTEQKLFHRGNHEDKLQMLVFIINAFFKNGKYDLSLEYTNKLGTAIREYDQVLYDRYVFFYYNSLVINYSQTDLDKAIEILEHMKADESLKQQHFYQNFILLNLAIVWFDKKQYKRAIRELTQLYIHDSFQQVDPALKFKIAMAELIIRYELADMDVFERRLEQIRKDFAHLMNQSPKDQAFIQLLRHLALHQTGKNGEANQEIQQFMDQYRDYDADTEIINYNNWLESLLQLS